MRLVELLNITSPNLLLQAAKDRYMQILPDSFYAKIIPEPNETSNALWNTVKKDFSENVTWAMQHLQRADRITWFLRYAKLRAIRLFLEQLKQYDSEFAISTGGQVEFQQAREALEQQVKRDTDKLIKATLADSQTLIEQLKNNMDVAFQKKSKIDSECQGRSDTNCRSRMTNARRVAEYTHDVYQITQTNYLRGNPSALPTIVRNEVSNFSEPRTGWGGFDQIK